MAVMSWIALSTGPWLAVATLVTILALVLIVAFRYEARWIELFRDPWRGFASSRGFQWIRASGPWYRRKSDAIEASVQGVPLRLDTYVVSTGKSHVTFTRARCELERPVSAKLTISPRTVFTA